jgi:hypothetical protein
VGRAEAGSGPVTEAEARAALRACVTEGGLERWIAAQRWEMVPAGWRVREPFDGWRFRLEPAAGGLRVVMSARGGGPAAWVVPAEGRVVAPLAAAPGRPRRGSGPAAGASSVPKRESRQRL